ncbi:cellulose biosynthesis cyclic di-GMP-binding regulatory protein BcsB [Pantoea sp. B65]|uniref:cellulose biosynthesis cyclic di-GMP-binding regulatory protein BcsB n=1 Tax=Pantoea sp. B65 TaxID=2813359 RepID=UPI0039B63342
MSCKTSIAAALLLCAVLPVIPLMAQPPVPADDLPSLPVPNSLLPASASSNPAAANPAASDDKNQAISGAITFADMGARQGLQLNSQQLQSGVAFTLPHNMVITTARLKLAIRSFAPQQRDQNLQLMLNGQPLGAFPLDRSAGNNNTYTLDVPASMIASKNNLSFQLRSSDDLINNDWSCQQPSATQGNITLQSSSAIELTGLWLNTRKTLADFPRPFFDPLQMKETTLNIAYSAQPAADVLTASAIVASMFGVINRDRNSHFNATFDQLPPQNGILFGKPGDKIGALTLPEITGSGLQIIDNPLNPLYKLLIVSGRNGQELRQAAMRLAQTNLPDSDNLQVASLSVPMRQPYDAPRWISTRQRVSLDSLTEDKQALVSQGIWHGENQVIFRASPDLFMWDGKLVPLELNYRFAQKSWLDSGHSFLNVSLNGQFLKSLPTSRNRLLAPLFSFLGIADGEHQQHAVVNIDPQTIYGSNRLAFYYDLKAKSGVSCQSMANDNSSNQIGGDSTLDLRHSWHFGVLPNTTWFTSALFPFTRYADLAKTVVMMPSQPEVSDVSVLLNLMARAGNATGVPANYVHIFTGFPTQSADNDLLADSDVIGIGAINRGTLMQQLLQESPFTSNGNMLNVKDSGLMPHLQALLNGNWKFQFDDVADFFASNPRWRGLVSFRSPWDARHVVVLATANDEAQLRLLTDDMNKPAVSSASSGDMLLISDSGESKSWRVGETFTSGDLPLWLHVLWFASQHIFALLLVVCLLARSASLSLYAYLKQHAAERLQGPRHHE